jgi:FtsP/CotA-like multicopper oxidase with cupredoxin domain
MNGADIADAYYPASLINGEESTEYPEFKEKVRLRIINGGASTSFWMTLGEEPLLVSADGLDVVPIKRNKTLSALLKRMIILLLFQKKEK